MEIFYQEPPAAEADSTFLAIPKKAWKLNELMDDMQKIWLPVFFEETCEKFFKQEPDCKTIVFPEEMQAEIHESGTDAECHYIVPVGYGKPMVCTYQYEVPEPDGLFSEEPVMEKLIEHFHITGQDLMEAPVLPRHCLTPEESDAILAENVKNAYIREVSRKLAEYMEQTWTMRDWVVDEIYSHPEKIVSAAKEGRFLNFQSDIVAGRLILDKDGEPATRRSSRYPYNVVPDKESVHEKDYRIHEKRILCEYNDIYLTVFDECSTASKPSVVIQIRPKTTKDYLTLFTACGKEMPDFFLLADDIQWFSKEYKHILGGCIVDHTAWTNREYADNNKGLISFPSFANINICTTKKEYKNYKKE